MYITTSIRFAITIWSRDLRYKNNVSKLERKGYKKSSLHPSIYTLPLTKIFYTNPLPMSMTTIISKTTSPFCHEWQRVRVSSRHLVSTRRASISIRIIIIVIEVIIFLGCLVVLRCLRRRRGRLYKAIKASLPSGNMTDTRVHLT